MEKEIFTVSDVYEHAASIGKDIEQIVQEYGKEAIEGISHWIELTLNWTFITLWTFM